MAVKEHVDAVNDVYGDTKIIYERVDDAIEAGATSSFAAKHFIDLVESCEISNEMKLNKKW